MEYAYALARAQMHLQDRAKDRYDAGAVEKEVKVGDFVRVFQPKPKRGIPFKFHLPWSEPKEAVRVQGVVLTVRDMKSRKTQTVHFDRVSITLPPRKKDKRVSVAGEGAVL